MRTIERKVSLVVIFPNGNAELEQSNNPKVTKVCSHTEYGNKRI
jgi:hypothetical protein